ncbi:hypothetical protein A4A49_62929, partial [Nicotiana attenuata]
LPEPPAALEWLSSAVRQMRENEAEGFCSLGCEWCCCYSCWKEERISLLKFKQNINYTNGAYFSTWVANETSNCCQCEGISCSSSSRKVTELSISV